MTSLCLVRVQLGIRRQRNEGEVSRGTLVTAMEICKVTKTWFSKNSWVPQLPTAPRSGRAATREGNSQIPSNILTKFSLRTWPNSPKNSRTLAENIKKPEKAILSKIKVLSSESEKSIRNLQSYCTNWREAKRKRRRSTGRAS